MIPSAEVHGLLDPRLYVVTHVSFPLECTRNSRVFLLLLRPPRLPFRFICTLSRERTHAGHGRPGWRLLTRAFMGNKSQVFLATCFYFYNGLTTRFIVDSE